MAVQLDPVEQVLLQFCSIRATIQTQLNTLPGPDPFRIALSQMDRHLSKVEEHLVSIAQKVSPLKTLDPFEKIFPMPRSVRR